MQNIGISLPQAANDRFAPVISGLPAPGMGRLLPDAVNSRYRLISATPGTAYFHFNAADRLDDQLGRVPREIPDN